MAGRVGVKIRRHDFATFTRQRAIAPPTQDGRTVRNVARELLSRWLAEHSGAKLRLLGVVLTDLSPASQLGLFDPARSMRRGRRRAPAIRASTPRWMRCARGSARARCGAAIRSSSFHSPMYLAFFGLNEKPFSITPDPRYLYLSERHAEAMAHLLYGINEAGGFVQLTGEVGTGKTTIVRSLLAQAPKNAEIALILNPRMTAPEFLLTICEELGIGVPDSATREPEGSGRHPEPISAARARRRAAGGAGGR